MEKKNDLMCVCSYWPSGFCCGMNTVEKTVPLLSFWKHCEIELLYFV